MNISALKVHKILHLELEKLHTLQIIWYSELTNSKLTRFYCTHHRKTLEWDIFILYKVPKNI